jgi:hypothetical protein
MMPLTDAAACRFVADYYGRRAGDVRVLGVGEWSRAYALVQTAVGVDEH